MGQASDGYNVAISHPEGAGLEKAMRNALQATKLSSDAVDYINAHATSTLIGDVSEVKAIKAVFNQPNIKPLVSSTKALTGHGLSLAGAMESAFSALAIQKGFTPGSAHISKVDPACEGIALLKKTENTAPTIVMKNASGFGGANVSLLFKKV